MKIWVVGASGMLGSALLKHCRALGIPSVGTSREQANVCDFEQMKEKSREIAPTHIVNCAAFTDVDGAEKTPEIAFAVNADGAANVATVAKSCGAHLIHISTDYVFDGKGSKPYLEEDVCNPVNVYGKSKWEGEKKVREILPSACILRTSWIFGEQGKNFISSLLHLVQQKQELQVVDDQCGKPTYCEDLVEAILSLLSARGTVHFANNLARSRYQIALDLLDAAEDLGIPLKCEKILPVPSSQFPTLAVRPSYSVLDTGKYFQQTGKMPRPWIDALKDYLAER